VATAGAAHLQGMTTTFLETDHPRAATGVFVDKLQSAPEVGFGTAYRLDATDHVVDDSFPIPQANDLEKVASIVDLVDQGADTGDAVAEVFNFSDRQGPYYLDAAGYLGLVEVVPDEEVKTYHLTALGQHMLSSSAEERVQILRHTVAGCPAVRAYADGGEEHMLETLAAAGLGDGTADRRGATAVSWHRSLTSSANFATMIDDELDGALYRVPEAARKAAEAREERRKANTPRLVAVCADPLCGMVLPASGDCEYH